LGVARRRRGARALRIAWFTETWLPNRDGVVTSLKAFRQGLEKLGHEVYIFAAGSADARAHNKDPRVTIKTGPAWTPYPEYRLALRPGPTRRELRGLGIDVIHSHGTAFMGLKAVRCSRFAGLPMMLTFHTRVEDATSYVTRNPAREAAMRRLIWSWHRWYFGQCDAVVTPTQTVKRDLERETRRKFAHFYVIPTGVDVERFARGDGGDWRARLNAEGSRLVVNVGRVAWEKNIQTVVEAAALTAKDALDVKFAIAGRGPALEHFRKDVERRGLSERVKFLGFVPDDELPSLLRSANAFLMASMFETQGIALLEAMAAGLPVASADAGGPTDFVVDGKNGFLFDGNSPQSCALATIRALEAHPAMREKARKTAARFTIESQARALAAAYEEVAVAYARSR
jgi:1,2-diacylglycerol 3-alpha-glucosyltransferase